MKYYIYKPLSKSIKKELHKSCLEFIQDKYNISIYTGLRGKEVFYLAGIYDNTNEHCDWLSSISIYERKIEPVDELRIATNLN